MAAGYELNLYSFSKKDITFLDLRQLKLYPMTGVENQKPIFVTGQLHVWKKAVFEQLQIKSKYALSMNFSLPCGYIQF